MSFDTSALDKLAELEAKQQGQYKYSYATLAPAAPSRPAGVAPLHAPSVHAPALSPRTSAGPVVQEGAPFTYDPSRSLPSELAHRHDSVAQQPLSPPPQQPQPQLRLQQAKAPKARHKSVGPLPAPPPPGAPSLRFSEGFALARPEAPPPAVPPRVRPKSAEYAVPPPVVTTPPPVLFVPPVLPPQTVYAPAPSLNSASPAVKRKAQPSLGCTLLARPGAEGGAVAAEKEKKHNFVAKRQLSPLTCAFCHRLRTTSQCFVCSECGMTVHKRCAELVTTACGAATSKSSSVGVVFQASHAKHRGLRALNLTTEPVACRGYLYKQSRHGDWNNRRYFVLVEGDDTLFYFASEPTSDLVAAVPSGGYPLVKADVAATRVASETALREYCIVFSHHALERSVLLAADTESDAETWVRCLRAAIARLDELQEDPSSLVWNMPPVQRSVFQESLAQPESLMYDRTPLFRSIACFEADRCAEQKLFVRVHGLFNYDSGGEACQYFLVVRLYYSGHNLCSPVQTPVARVPSYDKWAVLIESIAAVPPEAVLMISAYRVVEGKKNFFSSLIGRPSTGDGSTSCIGHVHLSMTNYGVLRSGLQPDLPLWPGEGSPLHFHFPDFQRLRRENVPFVRIAFPDYPLALVYDSFLQPTIAAPRPVPFRPINEDMTVPVGTPNPLMLQSAAERVAAWKQLGSLVSICGLPTALSGANYLDVSERSEVARVCCNNVEMPVATLLHLLSGEFSSGHVRALAARALFGITDSIFAVVLPLLVCALRFEVFDCSALGECLIMRAESDARLTHTLFWALVSQSDDILPQAARFRFLRRVMQARMGNQRAAIFVKEAQLAEALCLVSADPRRKTELSALLQPFARFSESIRLPLSPQFVVEGVAVDKCRVLSSNAAPIMVRFVGVDMAPAVLIKSGDDLRQDEFALLFGDLLNRIWAREGVVARVLTYRVISVKDKVGMLEMVPNVKSVGAIQGGVAGALKKDVLRAHFEANLSGSWTDLMQDFVTTLAGASVFEYILGIGDRHADNILLQGGKIFHIDFAYLMGNKTYFGSVPRETQPFTFPPSYLDLLGGVESPYYAQYLDLSSRAFNCARRYHVFLTTACMVGLAAETPHMRSNRDLFTLRDALAVHLSEDEARSLWTSLVQAALASTRQQLNDAAHNFVQRIKK